MNTVTGSVMRVHPRRFVGAGILTLTLMALTAGSYVNFSERPRTYTMEFVRGDRLADGNEVVRNEVVNTLNLHPEMKARVTGYTEPGNDPDADIALSVSRAGKVRESLIAAGVPGDRITAVGVGGNHPLARMEGETDSALSRRSARADIRVEK